MTASDLLEFFSTNSLSWEQLEYGGTGLFNLHYGLIHNGLPTQIDINNSILPTIKADNIPRKYTLCKKGDIAFADASEDTNDVGKAVEFVDCAGKDIVCGLHTIHGRDKLDKTISGFKGYAFSSKQFHDQIKRLAQGTKVFSISAGIFDEVSISIPRKNEQIKIAALLSLVDRRITIQSKVIERYESLIKAIRYHLFSTVELENEVIIADVLSYEQPTKYIVSDTEYSGNKDLTPVLTANKAFILGYTEDVEGIYDKGPCIIIDDFTLDSKIVDFPFKVKSSAIKILSAKTTAPLRYIYEYLKYLDLNTEEHKRHYIAEIEPMTIKLPGEGTIQSISKLFDQLDMRKKWLERDQQLLKTQKNYLLAALFI